VSRRSDTLGGGKAQKVNVTSSVTGKLCLRLRMSGWNNLLRSSSNEASKFQKQLHSRGEQSISLASKDSQRKQNSERQSEQRADRRPERVVSAVLLQGLTI
jgi:hypothetical protein